MYKLFDNVLDETVFEVESDRLKNSEWKFVGRSSDTEDDICFWYRDLLQDPFYNSFLFNLIKHVTGNDYNLKQVYANGQTYGLCGSVHKDSNSSEDHTFLLYMNRYWEPHWGGATIFCDDNVMILPKPNMGILFNGNIPHVGMEPSRHCKELRITVAYKLQRKT